MLISFIFIVMFAISWVAILKFDFLEGQKAEGFFLQGVYKELWESETLTEFAKIVLSFVLFVITVYILLTSLLIFKRLFIKETKKD
jgi:hypothetical protein